MRRLPAVSGKGIRNLLIVMIIAGFLFPTEIVPPTYEIDTPTNSSMVLSGAWNNDMFQVQLDVFRLSDVDPDADYYFIVYHLTDLMYENDSMVSPSFIKVRLNFSASISNESAPVVLGSYRDPDPGWLITPGLFHLGPGVIAVSTSDSNASISYIEWNISGTGGWPLLVHVMNDDLTTAVGIRVQEGSGLEVSAQSSASWYYINRYLGVMRYLSEGSSPDAHLVLP